jgi:hypothetical protein
MIPILVTGPGRSGTTLLMGILAHLPQVCVAELIPYETKLLSYYATAYHTLTQPADPVRSMHPDLLRKDGFSVGFNPFNDAIYNSVFHDKTRAKDFFGNFVPMEIQPIFAKIIDEYYQRLSIDQGKLAPIYFAEKSNDIDPWPRTFARQSFPHIKELVLYRDPRDLYCSRKAFFRYDPKRAMQEVTFTCHTLIEILDQGGKDLLAISYENLVLQLSYVLHQLSVFLEIPVSALEPDVQNALFHGHGTSGSPMASIGRWATDMTLEEQAAGHEAWHEFLPQLGYDQDNSSVGPRPNVPKSGT